jgi:hypothetical protein
MNTTPDLAVWNKWRSLINMTPKEIATFYNSKEGKEAGMGEREAMAAGLSNGRKSARYLMKMLESGGRSYGRAVKEWPPLYWQWARKQISFILRMKGLRQRISGDPFYKDGKKTRWLMSLLIWGHDPRKD